MKYIAMILSFIISFTGYKWKAGCVCVCVCGGGGYTAEDYI